MLSFRNSLFSRPGFAGTSLLQKTGEDPSLLYFLQAICLNAFVYIIMHPATILWPKVPVIFSLLVVFFHPPALKKPIVWMVLLAYFLFFLVRGYYVVANHHFVFVYVITAIILYTIFPKDNTSRLRFHVRWLLALILVLSALHKLLSPTYMDGSFFLFQFDMGIFLKPFKLLSADWQQSVKYNLAAYHKIRQAIPGDEISLQLKSPVKNAWLLAKCSSWLAVLAEFLAGSLIFLKPTSRLSHFVLLLTIAGIFLFRLETGFLSLLAAMGLLICPTGYQRFIYLGLILLFISMMAVQLGLR